MSVTNSTVAQQGHLTGAKIASNSFLSLAGNGTRIALSFSATILASRWLGAHDFGVFSLILAYTNFLNFLLPVGFDYSLPYFVSRFSTSNNQVCIQLILKVSILICIFAGIISLAIGIPFSKLVLQQKGLDQAWIPCLLLLSQTLLSALGNILSSFLRGLKKFGPTILRDQVLFPTAHVLSLLIFVRMLDMGILGYAIGYSLATLASLLFVGIYAVSEYRKISISPSLSTTKAEWKRWLGFSYPLGLMGALEVLPISLTTAIAGKYLAPDQVGLLTVCMKLIFIVQFFYIAVNPIFSSYFADIAHADDRQGIRYLYQMVNYWNAKWAVLSSFFLAFTADFLLSIFGEEFASKTALYCLVLILPGAAMEACIGSAKQSLIMAGRNKINIFNYAMAIFAIVVSSISLAPRWGVLGIAVSFSIGLIVLNLLRTWQVHSYFGVYPLNRRQIRNLLILFGGCFSLELIALYYDLGIKVRIMSGLVIFSAGFLLSFWKDRKLFLGKIKLK